PSGRSAGSSGSGASRSPSSREPWPCPGSITGSPSAPRSSRAWRSPRARSSSSIPSSAAPRRWALSACYCSASRARNSPPRLPPVSGQALAGHGRATATDQEPAHGVSRDDPMGGLDVRPQQLLEHLPLDPARFGILLCDRHDRAVVLEHLDRVLPGATELRHVAAFVADLREFRHLLPQAFGRNAAAVCVE